MKAQQINYEILEDILDANLWLMKHPTADVINIETMSDERLKLWYRV